MTPKYEEFAVGLAMGLSQAEAYRRAFPRAMKWSDRAVHVNASKLAARADVRLRVVELGAKAAAANEITVERVVRELAKVAFGDPRKLLAWGPDGVQLIDSKAIDEADAASVAEVSQTVSQAGGSLKLKRHDKVRALELLGKHVGAFMEDNKQRNPLGNFDPVAFFGDIFRRPAS